MTLLPRTHQEGGSRRKLPRTFTGTQTQPTSRGLAHPTALAEILPERQSATHRVHLLPCQGQPMLSQQILRRLQVLPLRGTRILWVHQHPEMLIRLLPCLLLFLTLPQTARKDH